MPFFSQPSPPLMCQEYNVESTQGWSRHTSLPMCVTSLTGKPPQMGMMGKRNFSKKLRHRNMPVFMVMKACTGTRGSIQEQQAPQWYNRLDTSTTGSTSAQRASHGYNSLYTGITGSTWANTGSTRAKPAPNGQSACTQTQQDRLHSPHGHNSLHRHNSIHTGTTDSMDNRFDTGQQPPHRTTACTQAQQAPHGHNRLLTGTLGSTRLHQPPHGHNSLHTGTTSSLYTGTQAPQRYNSLHTGTKGSTPVQ